MPSNPDPVGVLVIPLFTIPTRWAGKTRWELTQDAQECNDEINGILNETLSVSGQLLVKLFGKEEHEFNRYKKVNYRMIKLNIKESMAGRWFMVIINTFSSVGPMLLYLVGGILMMKYNSDLSVGDITVLVALLGKMYGPVNSLLNIQVEWIRAMALFSRIFEYFDMPIEIKNKENPIVPKTADGNIEFKDVEFSYNSERKILKKINFSLKSGNSIALVGPSGSGKSTIVNLIPRLYDTDEGEVLVIIEVVEEETVAFGFCEHAEDPGGNILIIFAMNRCFYFIYHKNTIFSFCYTIC